MTTPAPPIVDVLMPIYNAARTVETALRSITHQTLRELRVLAVDDGSTDGTSTIVERMAAADPRIVVVTTANGGVVDALNTALAASSAPYVARHDADDIAFADRLERQLAFLDANPAVVAVGCNAHHVDGDGRRTGRVTEFRAEVEGDPDYVPSVEPYLLHPFLLARRPAMVEVGGYRHAFHSEDTDLYWRLSGHGALANLTEALGEYRLHADSVSSRSVLNGRIAAVSAQLAALSERRRRSGKPDFDFPRASLARYHAAVDLQPIIAIAAEPLTDDERAYLEVSTAAKLVELSAYRPYRLTTDDRRTIRRLIRKHYRSLDEFNRRQLIFRLVLAKGPLLRNPRERLSLVPWDLMPAALHNAIGQRVRRILGRA